MTAAAASIEIELLAARAVTVSDNARASDLRTAVNPCFDRERRVVCERTKVNSLDVTYIAVGAVQYANRRCKIRVIGVVTGNAQHCVEELAVMSAPRIVRNGSVGFI